MLSGFKGFQETAKHILYMYIHVHIYTYIFIYLYIYLYIYIYDMLENVSLAVYRLGCMTTGISLLFVIGTNSGQQHLNHHVNRPYDIDIRPYKIDIKQYHPGDI